jgi:hypothetical protein
LNAMDFMLVLLEESDDVMKESFLKSAKLMYPDGVSQAYQHRDLVRVYSIGWCDALVNSGDMERVRQWTEEFKPLADLNWWPDDSWKWW